MARSEAPRPCLHHLRLGTPVLPGPARSARRAAARPRHPRLGSLRHARVAHSYIPVPLTYSSAEQPIFAALSAEYTPVVPVLFQNGGIIRQGSSRVLHGGHRIRHARPGILHLRRRIWLRHRQPDAQHRADPAAHHRLGRNPLLRPAPAPHLPGHGTRLPPGLHPARSHPGRRRRLDLD